VTGELAVRHERIGGRRGPMLREVAAYAERYGSDETLHPAAEEPSNLRARFDIGLPDEGRSDEDIVADLIAAAEPGLARATKPGFLSWVIGASHPAGVAADWLTSVWGQNAGIYQTSPASAACEDVAVGWLLDVLGLPRSSGVGLVTGATMASFVCLAAARGEVLRRAGYDIDEYGLTGAPPINIVIGADAHVSNHVALRYLGFGRASILEVDADRNGLMRTASLEAVASGLDGPTIIIAQAGHINSGGFDDFRVASEIAARLGAWLHVDGAFGLWARATPALKPLTSHVEQADSWAVDGHKWLQTPYDSGIAIVRDATAHRRAMAKSAGYLTEDAGDGRNPSAYVPELSRRARGFALWAMLQALGRNGIARLVEQHCAAAARLAERCERIAGVIVLNDVMLNQVALSFGERTQDVCDRLNETGRFFLRTADWRGETIMRVSFSGYPTNEETADELATAISRILQD